MRTYMEEYNYWLASDAVDSKTKEELQSLAGNEAEIEGRFKAMLTFGTAGLRGTMKAGIANMNVYTVRYATQGLANLIIAKGGQIGGDSPEGNGVAIAFDSRNNSGLFAKEAASVLAANGIKSYLFDALRPTPELSFAVRETGSIAGINITASHNPKEYNGYKAYWADGAQLGPEHADVVSAEIAKIDIFKDVRTMDFDKALEEGLIEMLGAEMDEVYLENVMSTSITRKYIDQVAKEMKIVFTPFHGAGYKLVPEILRRQGYGAIIPVEEQMVPDGNFPTVKSPNPENTEGFALAIEYAKKNGAELVIGVDPDSDRCGAVVKSGDEYKVLSDDKWLSFVIEQVLSNAVKYTKKGGIKVYMDEPGILCIEDTGIGISAEDLPRVFENGYTGFNGREDKRASGIGLYLCKRICDNLGHKIYAESEPGVGTKIRIDMNIKEIGIE